MSKEPTPRMDPALYPRDDAATDVPARPVPVRGRRARARSDLSSILAACGVSGEAQTTGPTAGAEGSPEWWADLKAQGPGDHLNFTNWPAYIDRDFSVDGAGSSAVPVRVHAGDRDRRHLPRRHQRQRGLLRDDLAPRSRADRTPATTSS